MTPSDSVAVIAAHAQECIPYFSSGLKVTVPGLCTIEPHAAITSIAVSCCWQSKGRPPYHGEHSREHTQPGLVLPDV